MSLPSAVASAGLRQLSKLMGICVNAPHLFDRLQPWRTWFEHLGRTSPTKIVLERPSVTSDILHMNTQPSRVKGPAGVVAPVFGWLYDWKVGYSGQEELPLLDRADDGPMLG